MFLFLKKFGWWFHYCKWIFDITHLESLYKVLECIAPKIGGCKNIQDFCEKAKAVINHGEHVSKHMLQELESLLQKISNHQTIRQFLGNREPTIGGGSGLGEAWTSAKMHAFLRRVASWEGGEIFRFHFRQSDTWVGVTSGDIQLHGHNAGAIHRAQIHQIWNNHGRPVTSPNAMIEAREIASTPTPRGGIRSSLTSSSSSFQTPRQTPRQTHQPLNVLATPVATPRTERTGKSLPINYLIRTPRVIKPPFDQKDLNWLLEKLWSVEFLTYLLYCYNLSNMQEMGHLWVFYDLLFFYKRLYQDTIFFNHGLQQTFFHSIRSLKLVIDALTIFLSKPPTENSLWNLRFEPLSKQQDFFEVLQMVIMHELWEIQTQTMSNPGIFIYKCSKGAWVQDPETFGFVLVPPDALPQRLTQIVEAA